MPQPAEVSPPLEFLDQADASPDIAGGNERVLASSPAPSAAIHDTGEVQGDHGRTRPVRCDGLRGALRQGALWSVTACVGGVIAVAVLGIAIMFSIEAIAQGLAILTGERAWLGNLALALLPLVGFGVATWAFACRGMCHSAQDANDDEGQKPVSELPTAANPPTAAP